MTKETRYKRPELGLFEGPCNLIRIRGALTKFGFEMNGRTYPLGIMFNMLSEHLFASQPLLKERRQPPTGGLRQAFKESTFHMVSYGSAIK